MDSRDAPPYPNVVWRFTLCNTWLYMALSSERPWLGLDSI